MVCVTLMYPGSQGEWTGMRMHEQWHLHCASQWGDGHCWVSVCTVWLSYSKWQIDTACKILSTAPVTVALAGRPFSKLKVIF